MLFYPAFGEHGCSGSGFSLTNPLAHSVAAYFDGDGKLSTNTGKLGLAATWIYAPLDRPIEVDINSGKLSGYAERVLSMGYDGLDRITSVTDSLTGFTTNLTYDGSGHVTAEQTPSLSDSVTYGYDADGHRTSMTASGNGAPQTTYGYSYDAVGELTGMSGGPEPITITYDNAGRRSTLSVCSVVTSYGYDANSRLTAKTFTVNGNQIGNLTYAYDDDGRLIDEGGSFAVITLPPSTFERGSFTAANTITS